MTINKPEILWEEETTEEKDQTPEDRLEFVSLLSDHQKNSAPHIKLPEVGSKIKAKIISITSNDDVVLDCNSKEPAYMAKKDLCDDSGELSYKVGDEITAYIIQKKSGEITLSTSIAHSVVKESMLKQAYYNKIPIKGRVDSVDKGGCIINLNTRRGFCPLSNMSLSYIERPQILVGKEFDFIVEDMKDPFNPLLTRRPLLIERAEQQVEMIKETLGTKKTFKGTVIGFKPPELVLN